MLNAGSITNAIMAVFRTTTATEPLVLRNARVSRSLLPLEVPILVASIHHQDSIVVAARSVRFNASSFELENIQAKPDGALHAGAIVNEEGETSTSHEMIELKLVAIDKLARKRQ